MPLLGHVDVTSAGPGHPFLQPSPRESCSVSLRRLLRRNRHGSEVINRQFMIFIRPTNSANLVNRCKVRRDERFCKWIVAVVVQLCERNAPVLLSLQVVKSTK